MTNPKEVLNDFEEKFSYNGEPKVVEPYERLDYDQWVYIKQFIISSQIATLTSQLEAIPEDENLEDEYDKEELELVSKIFGYLKTPEYMQERRYGKNQERQRQRQKLQLAINKWSELK